MTRSHARCAAAAENLASRAYVGPPYTVGQKFTRPACCVAASATDRYLLLTSAATGQTDGPTDRRTLDRFMTLLFPQTMRPASKSYPFVVG